jgi:hypothetical protein
MGTYLWQTSTTISNEAIVAVSKHVTAQMQNAQFKRLHNAMVRMGTHFPHQQADIPTRRRRRQCQKASYHYINM